MRRALSDLSAAIVGTGFIARVHARALRELGVPTVAVCGRTRAAADAWAAELGGSAFDNLDSMLEAGGFDVLHVCTPNALHAEQALLALSRGVHVICEKPLAVSTVETAALLQAAERGGLVGATCYHVRGYPLVEQMRADVAAGRLGRVTAVHGRYVCDDLLSVPAGWRLDAAASGPSYVVADLGTHWLDLAEYVTGLRVVEVLADFRSFPGAGTLEDYAALLLHLEQGAVGSLVLSARAAGRKNQLLFECEGSEGGLTWDQEEPTTLLAREAAAPSLLVIKDPAANAPRARTLSRYPAGHAEGYGGAFVNVFREAYRAIGGLPHGSFPTFRDGHRGVALVEVAVASARDGGWVPVAQ